MEKIEIKDDFFIVSLPIHKEIRNIKRTIILSDLIHRYNCTLDKKIKTINGKEYHFCQSKKDIYEKLRITKNTYNSAIKKLEQKGFITTFYDRDPNNVMRYITFFKLNIDLINSIDNMLIQK